MENIDFDSNQQYIQNLTNLRTQNISTQNSQTQNTKFDDLLSNVSNNNQSDIEITNIVKKLSQKYHVNITVTPNGTDRNVIKEGNFTPVDQYGCNNEVIIPRNLLNKMITNSKIMKDVEYAIKNNIDGFKRTESLRAAIGDKITYSSPLTFTEDGNWSASCSSVSENFSSNSKKIGIAQPEEEGLNLAHQKAVDTTFNKIGKVDNKQILEPSLNINLLNNSVDTSSYLNLMSNFNFNKSVIFDKNKNLKDEDKFEY